MRIPNLHRHFFLVLLFIAGLVYFLSLLLTSVTLADEQVMLPQDLVAGVSTVSEQALLQVADADLLVRLDGSLGSQGQRVVTVGEVR